jgi:hypothetical protein
MSFVKTDKDRNLYTNHRLHLNKLGKQLVYHQIAYLLYSIFEQKTSHPIFLGWHEIQDVDNSTCDGNQMHEIQDDNNLTCDENQKQTSNRNLSRSRRPPVTKSNDFLWQI